MKKILIISHNQFGYQINTYKYAQYLKKEYMITYFCFDYEKEKVNEDNISVHYVSKKHNKIIQLFRFILQLKKVITRGKFDLIISKYFPFCFMITFFSNSRYLLAIQTGSVSNNKFKNKFLNLMLKFETIFFEEIIILSESLRELLKLPPGKAAVVPLGAEIFSNKNYSYEKLDLIYIGTFNNRDIDKTILGLKYFIDKFPNIEITYKIIGFGSKHVEDKLQTLINNLKLEDRIKFIGLVPFNELYKYIEKSNVGISFVPITPYFDVQPPTKTIEYLLSGLPVIATATSENKKLVNDKNGILIIDTAEDFALGIENIMNKDFFNKNIRINMKDYEWENIVMNKLKPILDKIMEK